MKTTLNNNNNNNNNNAVPVDFGLKLKESENRDRYIDLARELKKSLEHERDSDTSSNWCTRINR